MNPICTTPREKMARLRSFIGILGWAALAGSNLCRAVEIDLAWAGGLPSTATLRPSVDGAPQLRLPAGVRIRSIRDGGNATSAPAGSGPLRRLNLKAGHAYTIDFEQSKA